MTGSRPCSSSVLLDRIATSEAVIYLVCLNKSACLSVFHIVLHIEMSFVFTEKFCWNRSRSVSSQCPSSFIYSQVSASSTHKPADLPSVVCVQMQVAPDHVTCVRLILRQPSSAWTSFSLENIQIHPQRDQVGSAGAAVRGTHLAPTQR